MGAMVWKEMPAPTAKAGQAVERQYQLPLAPPGKANFTSRSFMDQKVPTPSPCLLIPGGPEKDDDGFRAKSLDLPAHLNHLGCFCSKTSQSSPLW